MRQFYLFVILILCSRLVSAQIALIKPAEGEKINGCTTAVITWTQGFSSDVILDYSLDSGSNWTPIITTYGGTDTNRYNWSVPNTASDKVRIRISKYNETQIKDSTKLFTISADTSLKLTYPNGGESLSPGSLCTIRWSTKGNISKVSLFYSIDNGLNWTLFDAGASNDIINKGFYRWIVPTNLPLSTNLRIKIVNTEKECVMDYIDSFFTIGNNPSISILNPEPNEIWYVGKHHLLKWSSYNLPGPDVNIDFSIDNGKTWQMIDSNYYSATNTRYILAPNSITDQGIIRVSATDDNAIRSFVNFKIDTCSAKIISIADGEKLTACTTKKISWTQKGFSSMIFFDYSVDGGKNWRYVGNGYSTGDTSSYDWLVPNTASTNVHIRVRDTDLINITNASPAKFTIVADASTNLAITSPKGGESFSVNSVHPIIWDTKGNVGNVSIQFSHNGGLHWYFIKDVKGSDSDNIPNTGYFSWLVQRNLDAYANCLIKITDLNNNCVVGYSDSLFSIHNHSNIQILNPAADEVLYTGQPYTIKWLYSYLLTDYVNIDYSLDNGVTWTMIDSNFYYFDTHNWTVPNKIINQGIMRVSSTADKAINDRVKFKIATPRITLTSFTGGQTITGCDNAKITWMQEGTAAKAYLDYSFDEGVTWTCFDKVPQKLGANSYDWLVPNITSSKVQIQIRDAENASIKDFSKSNITILPSAKQKSLTLNTFNGGESISLSSLTPIRWSTSGSVGNVSLQYSIDGGLTWNWLKDVDGLNADNISNKGIYYWYVPANFSTSSTCMIKIYEYNESCIMDYNDAFFTINNNASIAITSPLPDTIYYVGRNYTIVWSTANLPSPNVNVHYSVDNGTNWVMLDSNLLSGFFYNWIIPKKITTQGMLKVSATANPLIHHTINFRTENVSVTLLSPVGGEVFNSCTVVPIKWVKKGRSYGSNVDYSFDSGKNWIFYEHFVELDDTNSYQFYVPNVNSSNVRIRVRDDKIAEVKDSTETDLTIIADPAITLTLTYPNGGESFSAASVKNIRWITKGNVAYISLFYSIDGGLNWKVIEGRGGSASYVSNFGSFDWLVPADLPISSRCLIKVVEYRGGCIIDYNDAFFSIDHDPALAIIKPVEGETRYVGKTYPIEWAKAHLINEYVAIEYSVDNGKNWIMVDSNATNACSWVIPNKVTDEGTIRARATLDNSTRSQVNFKIASPVITQINSDDNEPYWNVYPNPTTDLINLDHVSIRNTNIRICLINANGQLVYTESHQHYSGSFSKKIDMRLEKEGIYLLRIITDEGIITKKIIKN